MGRSLKRITPSDERTSYVASRRSVCAVGDGGAGFEEVILEERAELGGCRVGGGARKKQFLLAYTGKRETPISPVSSSKSARLAVTTVAPCRRAVRAIKASF